MVTSVRSRFLVLPAGLGLCLGLLAGCGTDDEPTAEDTTSASASPEPSETVPTEEPSETPEVETSTVGVYFVANAAQGPRLFKEAHEVPADNPLQGAADVLLNDESIDLDYISPFPAGGSLAVSESDGTVLVQLPDDSWLLPVPDMNKSQAKLAAASLAFTLAEIAGDGATVQAVLGDTEVALFGQELSTFKPGKRANYLSDLNVFTPSEGEIVAGTLEATGVANTFEANVQWQILALGQQVKEGFATAEAAFELAPWSTSIDISDLEPGDYEFVASTGDVSGGEGFGPTTDSKTFTVE